MAVVIEELSKSFGERRILDHFSAVFAENQTTCLMGPSGCGKTTLLRICMGLLPADSGSVKGLEGARKSAVFQEDRLCDNLSAIANIRLVCPNKSRAEIAGGMKSLLLEGCENQPARELSGGMRRRVALLRALYAPWDILFMDEPFKGLDEKTKEITIAYVKGVCRGRTVIIVTHDAGEAKMLEAAQTIYMG